MVIYCNESIVLSKEGCIVMKAAILTFLPTSYCKLSCGRRECCTAWSFGSITALKRACRSLQRPVTSCSP